MSDDNTPAKMGRSMKNLEMFMCPFFTLAMVANRYFALEAVSPDKTAVAIHGDLGRRDDGVGPDALKAVDHDALTFVQPRTDDRASH